MAEFQKVVPVLKVSDMQKSVAFYDAKCVQVIDPFGDRIRFNEDSKTEGDVTAWAVVAGGSCSWRK